MIGLIKNSHIWTKLETHAYLPLADLGNYDGLGSDDDFVSVLKEGFVQAQDICADLSMKPTQVMAKSWWSEPWIHEKKNERELFNSLEEEECEYDHILPSVYDVGHLNSEGMTVGGVGSALTVVEGEPKSEPISSTEEIVGLQSELHHILDDVLDKQEGIQKVSTVMLLYVELEGSKIYKKHFG